MITLLAALEEETSGLRRRMALAPEKVAGLRHPAHTGVYQGRPVLLAQTGMGRQRAEASAEAVLAHYSVAAVVSIGFCGALVERLAAGDLVLATALIGIRDPGDEIEPILCRADPALLQATAAVIGAELGLTVTAPGIAGTPEARQALARRSGAVAVDMESYWVARAAAARGLPFLSLRAVSDAQEDILSSVDSILDAEGRPSGRRLAAYLLREPRSLAALGKLARNAGRARRALTEAVVSLVAAL